MKTVAVILSGCGVFDGAEIHESVLVLLALDRADAHVICAAPDMPQRDVVNHITRQAVKTETRNVLVESARIARGTIIPLTQLKVADVDAIILPGGFGAAKSLCDFAVRGSEYSVHPELRRVLSEAHRAGKPLGFVCIAPAIAAKLFGLEKVNFTIGNDRESAATLQSSGGTHVNCDVRSIVIDERLKVVTSPAYMLAQRITEAEAGINKLVEAVLRMA
jgi:enhancing lycopene biosynthesis protein 2